MYQGKATKGKEFYSLLFDSVEFTSELGKVALASSKLEAEIILFLKHNEPKKDYSKATLGTLITVCDSKNILDKNTCFALKQISVQRNYLTHNIYSLFIDLLDETILEKENLLDSDVTLYVERAYQLKENLLGLAEIIGKENGKLTDK